MNPDMTELCICRRNAEAISRTNTYFFSIPEWAERYLKTELAAQSIVFALQWSHNELDGVSDLDHQPHDCLLNRAFRRRSKKTSELRDTGPFFRRIHRNSPHKRQVTRKMFPFDVTMWCRSGNSYMSATNNAGGWLLYFHIQWQHNKARNGKQGGLRHIVVQVQFIDALHQN